jgi:hypothetical protein
MKATCLLTFASRLVGALGGKNLRELYLLIVSANKNFQNSNKKKTKKQKKKKTKQKTKPLSNFSNSSAVGRCAGSKLQHLRIILAKLCVSKYVALKNYFIPLSCVAE